MDKMNDSKNIGDIIRSVQYPLVLKNVCDWDLLEWTLEDWSAKMDGEKLPFRCYTNCLSNEPFWERHCGKKMLKFDEFIEKAQAKVKEWMYFDYKYMHQWFKADADIPKQITWDCYGLPDVAVADSTMWIGSERAHTPCHQDTYGRNVVVQVYGRKRWILFPPESGGLQPTRVPYEESSIYSQLNFASPKSLKEFNVLQRCRMVELNPGDTLILPPRWWHFVENTSPVAIAINTWLPCEELDSETRVEEALTRLLVAQICKDLPEKQIPSILNPNEDDVPDIPLTVSILQVESTVQKCLEYKQSKHGRKRIKLSDTASQNDNEKTSDNNSVMSEFVIDKFIKNCENMHYVKEISNGELMELLKENIKNTSAEIQSESETENEENEVQSSGGHLTSAIINSFCHPQTIEVIKNNLLSSFK